MKPNAIPSSVPVGGSWRERAGVPQRRPRGLNGGFRCLNDSTRTRSDRCRVLSHSTGLRSDSLVCQSDSTPPLSDRMGVLNDRTGGLNDSLGVLSDSLGGKSHFGLRWHHCCIRAARCRTLANHPHPRRMSQGAYSGHFGALFSHSNLRHNCSRPVAGDPAPGFSHSLSQPNQN